MPEERHWRAAAHQAYYSVYHLACQTLGLDPANDYAMARHQAVLERVEKSYAGSARLYRMKQSMRRLRELRVRADYVLGAPVTLREVRDAIRRAEDILAAPS